MTKVVTLKNEKDFAHSRFKKSFSSQTLRLRVAQSHEAAPRFGFIIPKKVMPKVTDRNKVKRRMKVIAGKYLKNLKPADILIFPQKTSLKLTFPSLETELVNDFKRLNLWKS
ncbi:MAG: ribonuclease P protein component [Candidatus Doudnabacteria bacterium]|nr:ribonuclease P protein component [Candidatus Doudnabacteria bacterium]